MTFSNSVLEVSGAPPPDFSPGRMLNGLGEPWSHDIQVSNPKITVGTPAVGPSTSRPRFDIQHQSQPITLLSLEIANDVGVQAMLGDIPFNVVVNQVGDITLNSEQQPTPWQFLVKINRKHKQISLTFKLDYSGLGIDEALSGVKFYGALAEGGEFRVQGRHPLTGILLPIARGAIPAGSYPTPDIRFVQTLRRLAFIESKTGVSFTIPGRNIRFEEANIIAATARILETGHGQYTAKPWISVSNFDQAKGALESFANKASVPMAIHFEGEVVVIFGTHVMLGPVTFFCEQTHISDEDLTDLQKQVKTARADSTVKIRFSPLEGCSVEARYINWLPNEEASAMRKLPIYEEREPKIHEDSVTMGKMDVPHAVALLTSWYDEDADEQKEMWESIKLALDQDRLSNRKLFS